MRGTFDGRMRTRERKPQGARTFSTRFRRGAKGLLIQVNKLHSSQMLC